MEKLNDAGDIPSTRVPDMERIRNARRKRQQQIKRWNQYDKLMEKKQKKQVQQQQGQQSSLSTSPTTSTTLRRHPGMSRIIQFAQSIILLEAAARDDLDEVRKLLSQGVCPDVTNTDGLTALHQCCIDNNQEMCRLLLRFGANVNARDTELWTPLHAAATCCHADLCKLLIDSGADLLSVNADGNMPYDICEDDVTLDLIESEMANRGITQDDIDDQRRVPEREMLSAMESLIKNGSDLNKLDEQGAAPLHISAACGYLDVACFLLQHGAQLDLADRDGWCAIHIAACWGQFEVIEMLTNFGADIDATTEAGETIFDICEDDTMHERLNILKEELKKRQTQHMELQQQNQHNSIGNNNNNNGNNSGPNKARGLVRRRSSNPRSSSIRRTSMRDKSKMSWKEALQEADTCSLVFPSDDGRVTTVEETKAPLWMTSVEHSTLVKPLERIPSPSAQPLAPLQTPLARIRTPSNNLSSAAVPYSSSYSSSSVAVTGIKNGMAKENTFDGKKTNSMPRTIADPLKPRTSRSVDYAQPLRSHNTHTMPQPTRHIPSNGIGKTASAPSNGLPGGVLMHNAYYNPTLSSTGKNASVLKYRPESSRPALLSTGAEPSLGGGVIANPLQQGINVNRSIGRRDPITSRQQRSVGGDQLRGKCCVLM